MTITSFFVTEKFKTSSGHSKSQRYMRTVNPLHAYTHGHLMYKIFMINFS